MVENLKILILEDDQNDADLLLRELKKSGLIYTSEIVQTLKAFESALESFKPDIILADYSLPSFDGVTAFNIKQNTSPDIPFIIISGVIGEENAVELIRNGVTDYAPKDKLFVLIPKINRALKEAEEKKEKRIADEELVFQNEEKEKWAAELIIANKKLAFQNEESGEQFEAIFNDAPMGIAIIDSLTGNIFNVNPTFAKIAGRTIAEMTNIDWMGITHPDDIQLDLNNMAQLLAGEINGFQMEKRYIHSDGSFVWINMTISKILHYNKSHPRHLCMIEDITERKRAEQELILANKELKQANERFELIGKATNDGLWDWNIETSLVWGNEVHQQMYGLSLADPVPNYEEWKHRIHPEDRERTIKVLEETMASENNICITEYLFNTENIGWMNIYGRTLIERNKEGKPVRLIGSMMDITKRKKTEKELTEKEFFLRESQRAGNIGSYKVNFVTGYWQSSETLESIFGIDKNYDRSIAGWLKIVHPDDRQNIDEYFCLEVKGKRKSFNKEYRIVRNDNQQTRWVYGYGNVKFDDSGNITKMIGTIQDITRQKNAELERVKITADLIQRNKDLEQFSYIVSHNLRAPVANIIGFSAIAQDENIEPDMKKEIMEGLSHSVKRLDDVIIDLNNILQTRQGLNQNKEMVHFSKIANNIHTSIENLIKKEKAVLVWDFSEVDEMITIKSYLHSIFYNLIFNSLKYRQPGIPPVIVIKSHKLKDKIELLFKDNGRGIDMEKVGDQVFGLYKRFHSENIEGKGMGLYMVKTQVEMIGGKISISSEVNKGTEFKIEFEI